MTDNKTPLSALTFQPCDSHACVYGHPGGAGSAGGCRCLADAGVPKEHRRALAGGLFIIRFLAVTKYQEQLVKNLKREAKRERACFDGVCNESIAHSTARANAFVEASRWIEKRIW